MVSKALNQAVREPAVVLQRARPHLRVALPQAVHPVALVLALVRQAGERLEQEQEQEPEPEQERAERLVQRLELRERLRRRRVLSVQL